jgi:hypothetical protein
MANPNPNTEKIKCTQFKKGQSGNPRGRKKGVKDAATYITEGLKYLSKAGYFDDVKQKLELPKGVDPMLIYWVTVLQKGLKGGAAENKLITENIHGKPVAKVEQTNEDITPPTRIEIVDLEHDEDSSSTET